MFTLDLVVQSPEQYGLLRQLIKAEHKRVCAVAVWQRKAERVPGTTAAEHVSHAPRRPTPEPRLGWGCSRRHGTARACRPHTHTHTHTPPPPAAAAAAAALARSITGPGIPAARYTRTRARV